MGLIRVNVKTSDGGSFLFEADDQVPIGELLNRLSEESQIPVNQIRIICKGRILGSNGSLSFYSVADGHSLYLARLRSNGENTGGESNASPGLGMGQGMEGMMNGMSPGAMEKVMNSEMMERLLDNPELMRSLAMAHPELRAMMQNHPEIRHLLSDPEMLRETMRAARNPQIFRELMRNQDRAIANIESMPGGHNALQRIYRDIVEPAENSVAEASSAASQSNVDELSSSLGSGSTGPTVPNPWGNPSTPSRNTGSSSATGLPPFSLSNGNRAGELSNLMGQLMGSMQPQGANSFGTNEGVPPVNGSERFSPLSSRFFSLLPSFDENPAGSNMGRGRESGSSRQTIAKDRAGHDPNGPNPWAPSSSQSSAEYQYREQLSQLESMGFINKKKNIEALILYRGNVDDAVEGLIGDMEEN